MNTIRIYETDSHARRLQARVLSCEESENGWLVELDRTIFYPTGGGQPCDMGTLGGADVTETLLRGETVLHRCTAALPVGADVTGEIDWARRLDLMQQHSGEHLVSGLIHARFGYENVGFHMGTDFVTIDFSGMLGPDDLAAVEAEANEWIWKNIPIRITWPSPDELAAIPYRSKKELTGQVRIVTIPDVDICACCGTHVSNTGEIGFVKIFSCVKFHDGVRLEILCGRRALQYMSALVEQNRRVSGLLSAKPLQTADAAARLLEAEAALKFRAAQLEEQVFAQKAQALAGAGNVLLFEPPMTPDSVRRLTDLVMTACGGRAAVFAGSDAEGYKYAVGEADGDLRQLVKELNAELHGRGGGKPFFAQGSVAASRAGIEAFFAAR